VPGRRASIAKACAPIPSTATWGSPPPPAATGYGEVTLGAGDSLSQPAGVPHNVIARSDDFEVPELNVPAEYGTFDV
jgi:hypothetical protein